MIQLIEENRYHDKQHKYSLKKRLTVGIFNYLHGPVIQVYTCFDLLFVSTPCDLRLSQKLILRDT